MPIQTQNPVNEHFNKVYDDTFDEIKKYVAVKCSDISYIQDIIQEIYLEYYRLISDKGTDYARDDRAVIFKIAKRKVFSYYSLRQKLSVLVPLYEKNGDGDEYCVADTQNECDGGEMLSAAESDRLWGIIKTYPAETRKILYLYFIYGMTHTQISGELGRSPSYVKNRLYRTLAKIKKENGYE